MTPPHGGSMQPSPRLGSNFYSPRVFWGCSWESEAASGSSRVQVPAATPGPAHQPHPRGEHPYPLSLDTCGRAPGPCWQVVQGHEHPLPIRVPFLAQGGWGTGPPQLHTITSCSWEGTWGSAPLPTSSATLDCAPLLSGGKKKSPLCASPHSVLPAAQLSPNISAVPLLRAPSKSNFSGPGDVAGQKGGSQARERTESPLLPVRGQRHTRPV